MEITDRLKKRVGPLPLWGWAIVVTGGALAGYFLFRPKSGAQSSIGLANPAAASGGRAVPSGGGSGGGGAFSSSAPSPVGGGGGVTLNETPSIFPGLGGDITLNVPASPVQILPRAPGGPRIVAGTFERLAPTAEDVATFIKPYTSGIPAWVADAPAFVQAQFGYIPGVTVTAPPAQSQPSLASMRSVPAPSERINQQAAKGPGGLAPGGLEIAADSIQAKSGGSSANVGGLEIAADTIQAGT